MTAKHVGSLETERDEFDPSLLGGGFVFAYRIFAHEIVGTCAENRYH